MQTVDAHSGYDFPWSLRNFLPFWAGPLFFFFPFVLAVLSGAMWAYGEEQGKRRCLRLREQPYETHARTLSPTDVFFLLVSNAGADFHDHHHKVFRGNYATSFRWWDWLCNTDRYLISAPSCVLCAGASLGGWSVKSVRMSARTGCCVPEKRIPRTNPLCADVKPHPLPLPPTQH